MKTKEKSLDNLRHTASHLLAAAVLEVYPKAKPTLGPPIENGFYYDFDNLKISDSDLPKIEGVMKALVKDWAKVERMKTSLPEIKKKFKDNPFKLELIKEHEKKDEEISLYKSGEFIDLCKGGHIENPSKDLKYFKLLSVAGAYWRGDEKNKMLTRIYGTVFFSESELKNHLKMLEEAKKRDHRKIGKELDLFTFSDLVGGGLPLYTPKGAFIRIQLNNFIEELQSKKKYYQVWTPQIAKADLFKKSGHYDKYKDDMFRVESNYSKEEFYLKPMNCPQHTQIFASKLRSYKDLPLRITDFAMLYRDEKPGELGGLSRVRSFSQDDCHIFCREDQIDEEVDMALSMIKKVMSTFDFKFRYRLSTRDPKHPEKYLGDPKTWDKVEKWAVKIMKRNNIDYYDGPGEAAFYAPKMDLMATDALGREWQLSTVQIDYVMPERFSLHYINEKGEKETPVMLHRAIIGSPERFISIILEHYAGSLPTWLSPIQVKILPITEKQLNYSSKMAGKLEESGIRVELDDKDATLSSKVRNAQNEKVPYMLIIGEKEEKENRVSVRERSGKDLGSQKFDEFVKTIKREIEDRKVN